MGDAPSKEKGPCLYYSIWELMFNVHLKFYNGYPVLHRTVRGFEVFFVCSRNKGFFVLINQPGKNHLGGGGGRCFSNGFGLPGYM